jgi:hypothetical protein
LETMLKAFQDVHAYNWLDTISNSNVNSTSGHYRLLNILMSDSHVAHFQMLGSRKEMAELDKGGAGQNKLFWEDVALEFDSCSEEKNSNGVSVLTSAYDKNFLVKEMWTPPWKDSQKLRILYKTFTFWYRRLEKEFKRFKTSGNCESDFHDFCHGRLDLY